MKLIASLGSAYVRKVRIVMAEKKIDYDLVLEDPWSPDTLIQQSNPLGKVPCLMMDDGGAMFDSRVIVEYLDILTPVGKLIPVSGRERAEVKCWEALADGLLEAGSLLRREKMRPAGKQDDAWIKRQQSKIDVALKAMSEGLGDKPFCVGTHYSLADVATGCALDWLSFRFPDTSWREDYPELAKLLDKLSERQSFKDTAPQ